MWRIVGLPWPSSRMVYRMGNDKNVLKTKKLVFALKKKLTNPTIDKDKNKDFDKELGVEFPSSRFN